MSATISSERGAIDAAFAGLRKKGRSALVVYVTAGHPTPKDSPELLRAIERAGADVIEVGVPFSDPMADGPVIQASSQQALAAGMTFDGVLQIIAKAKLKIPVVLFSYLNPIIAAGKDALERAARAGAHGILLTDLPVGSDPKLEDRFASGPLAFVRLVAPTTPAGRMATIAEHGTGFVYLISRLGVTGARSELPKELPETIARLRKATSLPICVGFGVSTPQQAADVARIADGVVVGSAVVKAAAESIAAAEQLVREMRGAMDRINN